MSTAEGQIQGSTISSEGVSVISGPGTWTRAG